MTRSARRPADPLPTTAYVTWCCGHREVIETTLVAALRQPWLVVLVDYSDPHGVGAWAERLHHPRLRVERSTARIDAHRRPIQSQARAWQAGIEALPDWIDAVVLADPLALVGPATCAALAQRPAGEAWWQGDLLLALPAALARGYRCCPAYVGAGAEAADLRARLAAAGVPGGCRELGARLGARPPPPPLAAIRLLAQRVAALGLGQGAPRAALGRLAGAP
jgi:hypothetical protein